MDTLISSKTCPFAHRVEIVIQLSGAQVNIIHTNPIFGKEGWVFDEPYDGMSTLNEVYKKYSTQERNFSVPVLITNGKIITESLEICKMLMPSLFEKEVDVSDFNTRFSKAHYMAGHTKDLEVYKSNYQLVFGYLDDLDQKITNEISMMNIVIYCHLCRFDDIYHDLFRLNGKYIKDYPNIHRWMTHLQSIPAFADTLDIQSAKQGYECCDYHQPDKLTPYNHTHV